MRKRILAIVLSALMAFSVMPMAYAEGTETSTAEKSVIEEVSENSYAEESTGSKIQTAASLNTVDLVDSGKCGDNAYWSLDRYGKLTISGTGKLYMMNEYSERPWAVYLQSYKNVLSIEIKSGITNIPNYAFYGSSSVTKVTIPNTVTSIGKYAFENCGITGSLVLPESITEIGEYAFYECGYLTSVTIPSKIKTIKRSTFESSGLISVTIPKSVTVISNYAFYNISSLKHVYYKGTDTQWKNIVGSTDWGNSSLSKATLHCASHQHTYKTYVTTKATFSKAGTVKTKCSSCGYVYKTTTVPKISSATLHKSNFIYNGCLKLPYWIVKDSNGNRLKNGTDYTVSYSNKNSKNVGRYSVTITFKGKYSGSLSGEYLIKPKSTSLKSTAYTYSSSRKMQIYWNTQTTQTAGYQIQYSTSSNFNSSKRITVSGSYNNSTYVTGLKSNTTYYFRIRTYKYYNGEKITSSWSSVRVWRPRF